VEVLCDVVSGPSLEGHSGADREGRVRKKTEKRESHHSKRIIGCSLEGASRREGKGSTERENLGFMHWKG